MFFIVLWVLGIITAVVQLFLEGFNNDVAYYCEVILLHQFIVTFGLVGIIGYLSNILFADKTAKKLGWTGGIYQIKYGFSQIGIGVMGIMSVWFRGNFWAGTLVTMYVYGVSGLFSHLIVFFDKKKGGETDMDSVYNIIMDVAYQFFITVLSIVAGGIWVFSK